MRIVKGKCVRCGEQLLENRYAKAYRIGIPWLSSLLKVKASYICPICNREASWREELYEDGGRFKVRDFCGIPVEDSNRETSLAQFFQKSIEGSFVSLNYPSVPSSTDNSLLPRFEGTIQDGKVIDQHGDPDLMARFASEYLRQFWMLMPSGRLPASIMETMPALLLLYTATELALKAFWIRSDKAPKGQQHSLVGLYQDLDQVHLKEIESRFAETEICLLLSTQGSATPTVESILHNYSETYGGESNVHQDARYFAEPTTITFKKRSDPWSSLHGANLVKDMPYPIFLPDLVRTLIEVYWWFSGPRRIVRLGGDLQDNFRSQTLDSFGDYGLIPSSLGVIILAVSQEHGIGMGDGEVEAFIDFKKLYPTNFVVDWMCGGNSYLFYNDEGQHISEGSANLDGLECRIYSQRRISLKSRDLYLLADALEGSSRGSNQFGSLPGLQLTA